MFGKKSEKRKLVSGAAIAFRFVCVTLLIWQFADAINNDVIVSGRTVELQMPAKTEMPVWQVQKLHSMALSVETVRLSSPGYADSKDSADILEARRIFEQDEERLILVNKNNPLSADYETAMRYICRKRLMAAEVLYDDLTAMLSAAGQNGFHYWIASAYRSWDRQQALINEDVMKYKKQGMDDAKALSTTLEENNPAGFSEHETGLALDIVCTENTTLDSSQENCAGNIWLREHCAEYGFILRYPRGKEDITMIAYEPWHFRYVGREAAKFITERGLTLEEFRDMIK